MLTIDMNKPQVSEFMHRFTHSLLPSPFTDYFLSNSEYNAHNIRSEGSYHGSSAHTNICLF